NAADDAQDRTRFRHVPGFQQSRARRGVHQQPGSSRTLRGRKPSPSLATLPGRSYNAAVPAKEGNMKDDFAALYAFNRWANAKMLDACRKLPGEQYAAEPVPGWSSVRFTVYHIAIVTDGWLRALGEDPDPSFPAEAEVPTVDEAARILDRAYRTLDTIFPKLTPEFLATPRTFSRRGRTAVLPPWVVLRPVVNHTTYHPAQ